MIFALLTALLFALSGIFAYQSAKLLGGLRANFLRLMLGTLLLGIWAHGFGAGISGESFPYFLISGLIGFGLGDIGLFLALPRIGSRLSILLTQCLAVPMAAIIEWLWLGTTLTHLQIFWSFVILAGISLALMPSSKDLKPTSQFLVSGILFGCLAAFGQGFGAVLTRKANDVASLAGQDIDGISATYQRILGGLPIAFISFLIWEKTLKPARKKPRRNASPPSFSANYGATPAAHHEPESVTSREGGWKKSGSWVVLNSLAGCVFGVSCFQWALKSTPSGIVLPIVATAPVVMLPFTYFIEHDRPTLHSILGALMAVFGVVMLFLCSK